VTKPAKKASVNRGGNVAKEQSQKSEIGLELDKLRARYIPGGKLLNRRQLEREIAVRWGLR
jgi:hypothetical protein